MYAKLWSKDYTKLYQRTSAANYTKIWVGLTYYGGYGGSPAANYTKIYAMVWTGDYTKLWTKAYSKD